MTPEQKERAIQLITTWRTRSITTKPDESAVYGDCMTDILQDLVDAPEPEPVARVTGYYAGYLSIATVDGRVLPAGTALYLALAAPTPAEAPEDVARDAWYGSNPPSLVQATAIYMALLEAAPNPQKLSADRIMELFDENATPDRWPFGFSRAIDAAMSEKGGA